MNYSGPKNEHPGIIFEWSEYIINTITKAWQSLNANKLIKKILQHK
jgi:hypothetical protein